MLDTIDEVQTPEGVALHLRVASPYPRALAWGIDAVLRVFLYIFFAQLSLLVDWNLGRGLLLIWTFMLLWGYFILFEVLWQGQTPGKRMLGLRVVAADGAPIGWIGSAVRNLLRTVDALPIGYALGILSSLFDQKGRRFGDIVGNSVVVHVDKPRSTPVIEANLPTVLPAQPLLAHEQEALLALLDRAPLLTMERQDELASLVPDLLATSATQVPELSPAQRLRALAQGLAGR